MSGDKAQMLIKIRANLDELKKGLAEGGKMIQVTTAGMTKLAASLDGSKLEQRAHNITAAIDKVGGATKLTDAEAKRHLATLDAWVQKADRMGKEIPPDILKTRDALQKVANEAQRPPGLFDRIGSAAKTMMGVLGIAFSVAAIKSWVTSIIDGASKIDDLSKKIGVSREAVQRWSYAAEQSGQSIETVDRAVSFMNKTLSEGEKSTVGALKLAGLSFDAIRRMRPEDAFNTIIKALQGIEDPMTRARVAMELFGRTGQDLLPAIQDGFADTAEAAEIMSDETIRRLDAAGDAWVKFKNIAVTRSGEMIAAVMEDIERAKSGWDGFFKTINKFSPARGFALPAAAAFDAAAAAGDLTTVTPGVTGAPSAAEIAAQLARQAEAAERAAAGLKKHEKVLRENMKASAEFHREQEARKGRLESMNDTMLKTSRILERKTPVLREMSAAQALVAKEANVMEQAWLKARAGAVQLKETVSEAAAQIAADVYTIGERLRDGLLDNLKAIPQTLASAFTGGGDIMGAIKSIVSQVGATIGGTIGAAIGGPLGSSIGSAVGSLLGKVVDSLKGIWNAIQGAPKAVKVVLGLVAPPFGIAMLLDGNRGRDLVKDFAASFGGFDELQKKLQTLGAEGERLWIALTQGVGRNNPAQAKAAIEEVTAALEAHEQKLAETRGKVTDLIQAHLGAGQQIPPALQASINKLIEMGTLTADNAKELLGLTDALPSFESVKAAAETLGVSLDGVGDKVRNMAFAAKVTEVSDALAIMEDAGADMRAVLEQSVEKVQPLVTEAIKFGKEMPDAMRPYLQQMVEAGLLTDENGEKLKDLSGISFAEPLTKKLDDLIVKIMELIDALAGPNGAAKTLADLGNVEIPPIRIPYRFDQEGDGIPDGLRPIPQAHGGDWWVTKPTLFLAGEAGPERATFTPAGSASGKRVIQTVVMVDRKVLATAMAEEILG